MREAVALCRVSTPEQREGRSLEAQEKYVYECAEYLGVTIQQEGLWSLDVSSKKGQNLARKDLHEIKKYCKNNPSVDYLIVDHPDRFMRSVEEYYWWKVEFKMIGVHLAYAQIPEITHEDNPMAVMREMMEVFRGEVTNYERISKANNTTKFRVAAGLYPGMLSQGIKKALSSVCMCQTCRTSI